MTPSRDNDRRRGRGLRGLLAAIAVTAVAGHCFTSLGQVDVRDRSEHAVQPSIPTADRYANGRVFLERAARLVKPSDDVDYQVVVDDVMFRRGDMYMYCDSAHFYDLTNSLEAFGNVRMEQGDTLFVFADRLVYTDSTEMAVLYSESKDKVRLINRDVTLLTDIFYYDMGIELGYYETGGELIDNRNRLTSVYGEYAPSTKDAVFRDNVHLNSLSEKDTLNIWTDDLRYNTDTHIAELNSLSKITSRDGTIYTESGVYNTETTIADLYDRSLVVTSTGRTLTGDTLFYDHKLGYGEAWGNMVLTDTINKTRLTGDYGFYNELNDSAFVTGRAIATDYSSADSLSLHGDTLIAYNMTFSSYVTVMVPISELRAEIEAAEAERAALLAETQGAEEAVEAEEETAEPAEEETVEEETPEEEAVEEIVETVDDVVEEPVDVSETVVLPDSVIPADFLTELTDSLPVIDPALALIDSIAPPPAEEMAPKIVEVIDTTQAILAFPNVRFFRSDLQGVCDSMTYVKRDSLIYLDKDPIVWSGERQIFGNRILVHVNDSTADRVMLPDTGFMAEMIEEGFYNQMSGREMVAELEDGTLRHLDVNGNVLIVFFPINEEDSTYTKVANAESSFLAADFKDQTIEKLKMWSQSSETITPLYLAKKSLFFLPGFRWEAWRRPKGHDDLLTIPTDPKATPTEETPEEPAPAETPAEAATEPEPEPEPTPIENQDPPTDDNTPTD